MIIFSSDMIIFVPFQALEFSIVYEVYDELDSPDFDFSKPSLSVMGQHSSSMGSYSSNTSDNAKVMYTEREFS